MTDIDPDDDPKTWLTSRAIGDFLRGKRDNDIKIEVRSCLVPIGNIYYHPLADAHVIELANGEDLRVALSVDPSWYGRCVHCGGETTPNNDPAPNLCATCAKAGKISERK